MTDDFTPGLSRQALEDLLMDTIGHLGADDAHFTTKLAAGIAAAIDANNRALAEGR